MVGIHKATLENQGEAGTWATHAMISDVSLQRIITEPCTRQLWGKMRGWRRVPVFSRSLRCSRAKDAVDLRINIILSSRVQNLRVGLTVVLWRETHDSGGNCGCMQGGSSIGFLVKVILVIIVLLTEKQPIF